MSNRATPPAAEPRGGFVVAAGACTLTHRRPPTAASATGLLPTGSVRTTRSVRGLISDSVPSPLLATHTEPPITATPLGASPTWIVLVTRAPAGSMRATVPSNRLVTQT